MKKIFSLVCMATLALSFVACSDDDEVGAEYNRASTISVVKSDVLFSASAGVGTVVVKAQGPITFACASEWCKATALNDSTVQVAVDNNEDNNGRSSLLTIKSGVDSVNVAVHQQGFYLQSDMGTAVSFGDDASRESYAFNTSGTPIVSSTANWLSASIEGDSLVVSAMANETGHLRQGYVKYTFGEFQDSVLVSQYDFAQDIAGLYYLAYTQASGTQAATYAQIGLAEDGSIAMTLPQLDFTIPLTFNKATCQLSVAGGSYIGDYQADEATIYYIGTVLGCSSAGYLTWSKSVTYSAAFQYDDENGTYAMFEDDGSWSYPVDYLWLYAFNSTTFSSASRVGSLVRMYDPYLLKVEENGAKKPHIK